MSPTKRPISEVEPDEEGENGPSARSRRIEDHLIAPNTAGLELHYPSKDETFAPVPFQQPTCLLTFSYTPEHVLKFDDSALRYYIAAPPRADLRYGYDRWVKRPEEKGRLDGLLKAVSRHAFKLGGIEGGKWLKDTSVVSWRGVMTKILTAPYEDRDGWELNVMRVDDTLYLEEHSSDAKLVQKETMTPHHRMQSYYGYSFESYCTSSLPNRREPLSGPIRHPYGWGGDVDTNVQWCSVVKTKLGDNRMVIGGEVDCVKDKFEGNTGDFVELKTSISIRGQQDEARFEKKLLKFYFQSFLLGVPEIVVGFRTPAGQLTTLQSFKTMEIPRLIRGKPGAWLPSVCLAWGQQFLSFLKSNIASQAHHTPSLQVWRATFKPKMGVSLTLLDQAATDEVRAGEDRVGFLPKWYQKDLATLSSSPARTSPLATTVAQVGSDRTSATGTEAARPAKIPGGWQI